jgi:hypothetical protein
MAKFDNSMLFRIVLIVLGAFILFALINYYTSKQNSAKVERFYQDAMQKASFPAPVTTPTPTPTTASAPVTAPASMSDMMPTRPQPSEEEKNEVYRAVDFSTQKLPSDCFPKDRLTADDLLPKDAANNKWSQVSPAGQGSLQDVNLLSAGHHVGISTVAGTLRNANLQIRSEPPNPQVQVSPWLQTTIAPDVFRKSLEIGGDC